ncbi:MAG: hypothetical protein GEV09_17230 [Pseudonocardiaceae bacterium]|nr:hypothetical protein [Pseudonocardiaceae bacterium]
MAKRFNAAAGLLALLLTVAACGSSQADKPADQILNEARKAANEASSVRITGDLSKGANKGKVSLLLTNSGDGKEEISSGGQTVSIVKVGDAVYAKGIPNQPSPGFQKLSAQDPAASKLVQAVNKKALLDQLLNPQQKFTKAGTGKIGDQDVVKLKPQQGQSMFYIADDSEDPYPMKIESKAPQGGLTITFSEWDAGAKVKAPATAGN